MCRAGLWEAVFSWVSLRDPTCLVPLSTSPLPTSDLQGSGSEQHFIPSPASVDPRALYPQSVTSHLAFADSRVVGASGLSASLVSLVVAFAAPAPALLGAHPPVPARSSSKLTPSRRPPSFCSFFSFLSICLAHTVPGCLRAVGLVDPINAPAPSEAYEVLLQLPFLSEPLLSARITRIVIAWLQLCISHCM